ncbi:hypothetical protein SAMN04489760_1444 [Syntrophus gentianae]|uniref:Uncharacterized protein n=1 Tax=Syntrophus gentianae TaxID=43775 RepID=A0A1H8B018_9BACT|nr:hypothetical protein [Syntrophus gentianae]SEM76312.1 hypothetical protein SAMN04489760_1444 [Syntrophus gentianae]
MKLSKLLMVLSFFVFFELFVNSALAEKEGKLPIFPDATEKVCSDYEGGACLESPTLRVQFSTYDNLAAVVQKLLNKSKKYGWKMYKIPGSETPRYQSSNSKGFVLLWSVDPISAKSDKSCKITYNIYYWKIYGE